MIRKGQGLVVHTHDCRAIAKLRSERGNWVDVEWEPGITGLFEASIKVVAKNVRGVLARIAAGIAEAGSNIVNISMDDDSGEATTLFFTLQVSDRVHLAHILRSVRRIPEVVRITRYVDHETQVKGKPMAHYESEHTKFMREWLEQHPEEKLEQQKGARCGGTRRRASLIDEGNRGRAGAEQGVLLRRELSSARCIRGSSPCSPWYQRRLLWHCRSVRAIESTRQEFSVPSGPPVTIPLQGQCLEAGIVQ
jgi:hypothetical protein